MYTSITITIATVPYVLNKINQDSYGSEFSFRDSSQVIGMRIRHSKYNDKARGSVTVERHNVELKQTLFAASPSTVDTVRKAYLVFENDFRDDVAEVGDSVEGLIDFLTDANIDKLLAWEN